MRGGPSRSAPLWGQHFCLCCVSLYRLYSNKSDFNVGTLLSWSTFSVSSNIIQWCILGSFHVYHCWQCETSPVNTPMMCSVNVEASLCVENAILVVSTYILVVFLDICSFEGLRCSIYRLLGLALLYICAWLCSFWWFGWLISSRPNQVLSTNRGLLLIFNWTCFSNLLYFIPAYILSSLLLNDHQYIICLVTSRMLHSPILDGIVM